MRKMFLPLKLQTDVMIQTDPFIAPGVVVLEIEPAKTSLFAKRSCGSLVVHGALMHVHTHVV